MLSWPIRRHAEGPFENMWRAMATDCKISSPLSPNCGVPLELPVAVRSKPIAQLARYIARVSPARGRGLAHEIKYDGFRSARGSGYLAYGLIARKPGGSLLPRGYRINACKGVDGEINKGARRSPTCSTISR